MVDEFTALILHGTWKLVLKLYMSNLVGCKWVFYIKRHPNGNVERFKTHLVTKGFNQCLGVDYI